MGTYRTSTGERYTQQQIDRKIRQAKQERINIELEEHGYVFCQDCKRNDCRPVDMSHTISVDWAKKNGQTELCWYVPNIIPRGRPCHRKHDKL